MRAVIMQPYFFPYLGYFQLIVRADEWLVSDAVQDIRHGWVHRNRILHPHHGWQYIIVPRQHHPVDTPIHAVRISGTSWKGRIRRQLEHYHRRAPHYRDCIAIVDECLATETGSLNRLNVEILKILCRHLQLPFSPVFVSELPYAYGGKDAAEATLNLCKARAADAYLNPGSGRHLYSADRFAAQGVELEFQDYAPLSYDCPGYRPEPGLSIIDALMWLPTSTIREHLLAP